MLYPLTFHPIVKPRVWGGRNLERLYQKPLPANVPIGESWEIADRPDSVSVIANGPLAGRDLRWLMERHAEELLGDAVALNGRFPLLVKILDAQEKLSLQVHPPAAIAAAMGGEPKTEMWYIAAAEPGAELYVGLGRGVTRAEFEQRLGDGTVAECFHRLAVTKGDVMFLPSGRVHAIGAGLTIFEIQQNSDTTYRVFDWNRVGLDGTPRELHVEQSLRCIDFDDVEPALIEGRLQTRGAGALAARTLVDDPLFSVEELSLGSTPVETRKGWMEIFGVLEGTVTVECDGGQVRLTPGQFCLKPAVVERAVLAASLPARVLSIRAGV